MNNQQKLSKVDNRQALAFAACPNPDHTSRDGWWSRQLYYSGNGIFKCGSCGREFTHEEVISVIKDDYELRLQELRVWYQERVLDICKDNFGELDGTTNEMPVVCNAGDESRDV